MSQCMSPLGDLKVLVSLAQLRVRNSEISCATERFRQHCVIHASRDDRIMTLLQQLT